MLLCCALQLFYEFCRNMPVLMWTTLLRGTTAKSRTNFLFLSRMCTVVRSKSELMSEQEASIPSKLSHQTMEFESRAYF